jgi:hypothetical protein
VLAWAERWYDNESIEYARIADEAFIEDNWLRLATESARMAKSFHDRACDKNSDDTCVTNTCCSDGRNVDDAKDEEWGRLKR